MHTRTVRRRPVTIVAVALVAMLALAATASAILTGSSGGSQSRMDNRGENAMTATNSVAFVPVPGSDIGVTIPTGTSRLINARYTAESSCVGTLGQWCATRIIATNMATGAIIELDPVAGMDFHFDSAEPNDRIDGEAHAMERSKRLAAGAYRLTVQRAVTANTVTFLLDDWHFAVEQSA